MSIDIEIKRAKMRIAGGVFTEEKLYAYFKNPVIRTKEYGDNCIQSQLAMFEYFENYFFFWLYYLVRTYSEGYATFYMIKNILKAKCNIDQKWCEEETLRKLFASDYNLFFSPVYGKNNAVKGVQAKYENNIPEFYDLEYHINVPIAYLKSFHVFYHAYYIYNKCPEGGGGDVELDYLSSMGFNEVFF